MHSIKRRKIFRSVQIVIMKANAKYEIDTIKFQMTKRDSTNLIWLEFQ